MSPAIVITDLELAKQITTKEFNRFLDRGFYVNEKDDILTKVSKSSIKIHLKYV